MQLKAIAKNSEERYLSVRVTKVLSDGISTMSRGTYLRFEDRHLTREAKMQIGRLLESERINSKPTSKNRGKDKGVVTWPIKGILLR